MLEFGIVSACIANLAIMVALKYRIDRVYDENVHKFPLWMPTQFCLLCFSFWTGVGTAIIFGLLTQADLLQVISAIAITPTLSIITNKW